MAGEGLEGWTRMTEAPPTLTSPFLPFEADTVVWLPSSQLACLSSAYFVCTIVPLFDCSCKRLSSRFLFPTQTIQRLPPARLGIPVCPLVATAGTAPGSAEGLGAEPIRTGLESTELGKNPVPSLTDDG